MRFQVFTQGVTKPEAEWARPGKVEWPDMLRVKLDRPQAIRVLASLARQLEAFDDNEVIELGLSGKLEPLE